MIYIVTVVVNGKLYTVEAYTDKEDALEKVQWLLRKFNEVEISEIELR